MRNPYLSEHETSVLIALIASVTPKVMLEFGVNTGITAQAILDAVPSLELYIGIDVPFHYTPRLDCQRSEVPYQVARFVTDPRFKLLIREIFDADGRGAGAGRRGVHRRRPQCGRRAA